jgi:hypothetical protein
MKLALAEREKLRKREWFLLFYRRPRERQKEFYALCLPRIERERDRETEKERDFVVPYCNWSETNVKDSLPLIDVLDG